MSRSQKRTAVIFTSVILCFALLFLRVFLVATGDELQSVAKSQSSYTLTVDESRGTIYDCNFQPMVNSENSYVLSILPSDEAAAAVADALPAEERVKALTLFESGKPFLQRADTPYIYAKGIDVFNIKHRYAAKQLAAHIIGHLDSEGKGAMGVERAYDELLTANSGRLSVTYTVDALRRPLASIAPEVTREGYENPQGVVLTLDKELQQIAEEEGARMIQKGAVIIMEAETGKIRAAASFPSFLPTDIAACLNDKNSPLVNRCFAAYNVGSTFKLSGLAAALEAGITTDYKYTCVGNITADTLNFYCHNRAGHGELDMNGALEHSCNPYFINLGQQTGYDKLYEMAVRMGFGRADELGQGMKTASGSLPEMASLQNKAVLANFSFGQGELTATPVQIAKLVAVFANGGKMVYPSVVEGISDETGTQIATPYERPQAYQVIPQSIAETVKQMMVNVVEKGSGKNAKPIKNGAGGKTGSAQTGVYEGNKEVVHAWFAGFFPAETPKYVVVVLNEGMDSGGDYAAPVFREIADRVQNLELRRVEKNS